LEFFKRINYKTGREVTHIMAIINQTLRRILHYGQLETLSHTQNRKIFNVNFACLIAILSSSLYSLNLLIFIDSYIALVNLISALPFFILYLTPLWLNYNYRYKLASWVISLSITASVAFSIWVISGTHFNLHYYFILFAIAPLLFFRNKDWNQLLILYLINIALFVKIEYFGIDTWLNIEKLVDPESQLLVQASNVVFSIMTLWFITFLSEQAAQENEERLENLLTESKNLQVQISEAKEISEAANKAKSIFLANMSHEIRTPLNGVIGFTDLLKSTPLTPVQQEYVNNANVSGHTLLGIINDILDFSKIEAGQMDLELIQTDMIELLKNSIDIVKFQADSKNLALILQIDPDLPRFTITDPIRLKQILVNLLGNAVKFTEKGEVELKVTFEPLSHSRGKFSFTVRDTGIGITKEQEKKLFKAFSQADSSTTRKFGGTGLGLIISDLIAKKLGGKIYLTSKQGVGTTFYFEIIAQTEEEKYLDSTQINKNPPLSIGEYKTPIEEKSLQGLPNFRPKILIAEDVSMNMLMIKAMLKKLQPNIELLEAVNGIQVLKQYSESRIDLIFMDVQMPEMDGLETTREIRKIEQTNGKHIPIVALTAGAFQDEREKCISAGMDYFLTKPIESKKIKSVLEKYLNHTIVT
jgi:signal transduction histidine kinase